MADTRAARGDNLLDHEYDGIREYDNPTPGWWHLIFMATVFFSIIYFAFWTFSPAAWTIQEAHQAAQTRELRKEFAEIGELSPDEATILRMMGETKWMAIAEGAYRANCTSCHGASAQGEVGPNMTDDHYKNVKALLDIPRVIAEGANNGAMPAWRTRLSQNEIVLLSAYVATLRGGNLPGPRGQEGEVIPPWPKPTTAPTPVGAPAAAPTPGRPGL